MKIGLEIGSPLRFIVIFLLLFSVLYFGNILFFGMTSPGNHYIAFLDRHLNYIRVLRHCLLAATSGVLRLAGFEVLTNDAELLVPGHGVIILSYSCLGLGVMSMFTAFVAAYPRPLKAKLIFGIAGIIGIQTLNIIRFVILELFWGKKTSDTILDHHTIFNCFIYLVLAFSLYFWIREPKIKPDVRKN